ncbi:hypothetical protein REB14_07250 [Chryseobacterium sp. ES2]|uniref:Uncharacterized protein n=1 Tax=Chryseobacterium metallicongregator TaxID=3073042 RepID=A0ABU1E2D8_9FLAO|nr:MULTISPECIES: hypothetical protein [Chryseobacterium]MDR4951963.1 hypothetical protein [Chryseobacterium sp. ES2]
MKPTEKIIALGKQIATLIETQTEFTSKALLILSLGVKSIYSKEEAALFFNLDPDYLYQLKHHWKILHD